MTSLLVTVFLFWLVKDLLFKWYAEVQTKIVIDKYNTLHGISNKSNKR